MPQFCPVVVESLLHWGPSCAVTLRTLWSFLLCWPAIDFPGISIFIQLHSTFPALSSPSRFMVMVPVPSLTRGACSQLLFEHPVRSSPHLFMVFLPGEAVISCSAACLVVVYQRRGSAVMLLGARLGCTPLNRGGPFLDKLLGNLELSDPVQGLLWHMLRAGAEPHLVSAAPPMHLRCRLSQRV